jgi:hypothetical protein
MRFGPTFATVENERGELLANAGADPFKVPVEFLNYQEETFKGMFDSETATNPPADGYGGPRMAATHYESYQAFKEDYLTNPVYQELRRRQALRVAAEWAVLRRETPPAPTTIAATVRQPMPVLEGETVRRFFLDDDEGGEVPLALIDMGGARGGLVITATRVGYAPLTVQTAAGIQHFELVCTAGGAAPTGGEVTVEEFVPGWQTPRVWSVAGGYASTPRYHQTKDE